MGASHETIKVHIIKEDDLFYTVVSDEKQTLHQECFHTEAAANLAKDLLSKKYAGAEEVSL